MRNIAADTVGEPAVNITIFVLFVVVTLVIVARAARNNWMRRSPLPSTSSIRG